MPKKAKTASSKTTPENIELASKDASTRTDLEEIRICLEELSNLLACAREACSNQRHDAADGALAVAQREITSICTDIEMVERRLDPPQA